MNIGFEQSKVPLKKTLLDFSRPNEVSRMLTRCDKELGGFSTVNLDINEEKGIGHFHGTLSLDLPPKRPDITRSGYAMFRTVQQKLPIIGSLIFEDLQFYTQIALRVKGDRRKYMVNIQAQSGTPYDIYQHRLFLSTPGEWETVLIPIDTFVLTSLGNVEEQAVLERRYIKTIGVGILDRQHGPYSLEIKWIKALTGGPVWETVFEAREKHRADAHAKIGQSENAQLESGKLENDQSEKDKH